jgi:protein TonB
MESTLTVHQQVKTNKNNKYMEAKKTHRADLQNRRGLFMEIGLVLALLLVAGAFWWGQSERKVEAMTDTVAAVETEQIVNTEQEQKPPEVRQQQNQVLSNFIEVLRDDAQIATEYSFDDFNENLVVEVPVAIEEEVVEEAPVYTAEEMPSFQGGDLNTFREWVVSQLKYPRMAEENNITGTVSLRFVIERDGSLSNIEVLSLTDRSLNEEAVRVLNTSPKWEPGKQRNRPVRVYYTLPVVFRLDTR